MSGPTLLGGVSIMNMANSLLDNGRAIFARNGGPGMSARSRQMLEGFYNNASSLFNQLYVAQENKEVANNITILALRSKHEHNVAEGVFKSTTTGTNVDTQA